MFDINKDKTPKKEPLIKRLKNNAKNNWSSYSKTTRTTLIVLLIISGCFFVYELATYIHWEFF